MVENVRKCHKMNKKMSILTLKWVKSCSIKRNVNLRNLSQDLLMGFVYKQPEDSVINVKDLEKLGEVYESFVSKYLVTDPNLRGWYIYIRI